MMIRAPAASQQWCSAAHVPAAHRTACAPIVVAVANPSPGWVIVCNVLHREPSAHKLAVVGSIEGVLRLTQLVVLNEGIVLLDFCAYEPAPPGEVLLQIALRDPARVKVHHEQGRLRLGFSLGLLRLL